MPDDWERVDTGAPDPNRMARAGAVAEDYEPLVVRTAFDDPVDPRSIRLHLDAGIRADAGRFDVTLTDRCYYRYHYTEGVEFNYRYGRYARPHLPDNHFHAPPDSAHDAVPPCIEVTTVRLVTLAVLQLGRETVDTGDLDALQGRDPP